MKKIALYSMSLAAALCANAKVDVKAKDSVSGLYVGVGYSFSGMSDPFEECSKNGATLQKEINGTEYKPYKMEHNIHAAGINMALEHKVRNVLACLELGLGWGMNAHGKNVYATTEAGSEDLNLLEKEKDGKHKKDFAVAKYLSSTVKGRAMEHAFAASGKISIGYALMQDSYVALFYKINALLGGSSNASHEDIYRFHSQNLIPIEGRAQSPDTVKLEAQLIHVIGCEYIHHFGNVAAKLGAGFAFGNGEVGMAKGFDVGLSVSYKVM